MKRPQLLGLISTLVCLAALPSLAKDKPGKSDKHGNDGGNQSAAAVAGGSAGAHFEAKSASKEPWIAADVRISEDERRAIKGYVEGYGGKGKSDKHGKPLPPGLAKKVARGERLPPGWQKKCVVGQVMPAEVYQKTHPVPPELVVKLPPPPPDTVTVTVGGKVVRLAKATLEILDVFDVHLGR